MVIAARPAAGDDLVDLVFLYRGLEDEMNHLHDMWARADGLPEPVEKSLAAELENEGSFVAVGTIDDVPFGFLLIRIEELLPQADGEQLGAIRLIFVDPPAREVGVGEAMLDLALEHLRSRGITRFDAHVLPGHRLVKNFFEAGGFAARSIIMHHVD